MKSATAKEKPPHRATIPHPSTLGPVPDLEAHVRPDWWRTLFNALYLKTDGDVVEDEAITRYEVDRCSQVLGLLPEHAILDLCCGQGRHMLELARRGFLHLDGVDRSHYLVQQARARAAKEGLKPRFREGDARKLPYPADSFDFVMLLGNSFGYFASSQDDQGVLREVLRVLKPGGTVLLDLADGEYLRSNYQPRSWEWLDQTHFVCRERSLSRDGQRLISREVVTHVEKGVLADQFYAERLYSRTSLQELLDNMGFQSVAFHDSLSTESGRHQDLGMMEQRLLATAKVRKSLAPARRATSGARNVTVVLGDPRRPDAMKPGSVFDADDAHTVLELKRALDQLPAYRFTYLDRHDILLQDLRRLRGKADLVLNLCDEGLGNDPRQELHVPALLDLLGLPYTGAGPQSLARCYDKSLVRGVAQEMGIPVPRALFLQPGQDVVRLPFAYPVIVKPNFGDSSFAITQRSVAWTMEELESALAEARERIGPAAPLLVEEFLPGKDLSVGIIGNPPGFYRVLPIIEEDYSAIPDGLPRICGYEAKWYPDSPYAQLRSIRADLPEETQRALEAWSLQMFERLECRDYARFDWRLDRDGNPRLLEVNPNPGWCWDGHLAKMAQITELSYPQMLGAVLAAAESRLGLKVPQERPVKVAPRQLVLAV